MISTSRTSDFQISGSAISSHKNIHGAYSIEAEANYKVGFLGSGYIYIWTPDEVDPDNVDEGFYKKID